MKSIPRAQRSDEEGFAVSSITFVTNIRTCVSVKIDDNAVRVRDTKDPSKTTLTFTPEEWRAFIGGVKVGEFDV